MSYVILVNDDNTLSAPKKQRIVQRSKLVNTLWFLTKPTYNGHDMTKSTVLLEYLKPASKKYETEILVLSEDMYEDHLKYLLPVDTKFTDESGSLELQLSFIYVDIDADGNQIQRVRKIAPPLKVEIVPLSAWSDIVPDNALTALDKRLVEVDLRIKALNDMNSTLNDTKADNLVYKDSKLQLLANGNRIGDAVVIQSNGDAGGGSGGEDSGDEEGFPVVDFDSNSGIEF